MNHVYIIKWSRSLFGSFDYGSSVRFDLDQVEFSNVIMSPGETIHFWSSRISQSDWQFAPTLPLLKVGQEYSFDLQMVDKPYASIHLLFQYFDGEDNEIGRDVFTEQRGQFILPTDAQSYKVSLLNLNNQFVIFNRLIIKDTNMSVRVIRWRKLSGQMVQLDNVKYPQRLNSEVQTIPISLRYQKANVESYVSEKNSNAYFIEWKRSIKKSDQQVDEFADATLKRIKRLTSENRTTSKYSKYEFFCEQKLLTEIPDVVSIFHNHLLKLRG
ncbi:MAG TPA: accessory Sec system protein Asp3 [Lactobacillus sp.]|nr:accessory Sec system protein Asp3 [Lactobacillus sp.]